MTQPLNYTPKAIEELLAYPCVGAPATVIGNRYIADKLREAQVFVLADHGQLLDRGKPRPQVPEQVFRPPFPVVALEYTAAPYEWTGSMYDQAPSSKRIALAWDWSDDLPPELRSWLPPALGPGVVVASVCFHDTSGSWIVVPAAMHIPYEGAWTAVAPPSAFRDAMIAEGRMQRSAATEPTLEGSAIVLSPETVVGITLEVGGIKATTDLLIADTMDEVNAYLDLCIALACKNVSTREHAAPASLNRQRLKRGKLPLKGFHVLELAGGQMPGAHGARGGSASSARSHLRRGHIRRLDERRVTWVNSTIVRGRGFIDKVYAA